MGQYIVTDLTRFSNPDIVCIGVIDTDSGQCLRPMPYLKSAWVERHNVQPGTILTGKLALKSDAENPHVEDAVIIGGGVECIGSATSDEFKAILDRTLSDSIAYGFGYNFAEDQKHIPFDCNAKCSLVTVKIQPSRLRIFDNSYKIGDKRASFTDATRRSYNSLSITDRGFPEFIKKHQVDGSIEEIQQFYSSHEEIYLRVGVSRRYCPPRSGNDGYWLQVNGIYGYPEREFPI